MSGMQSAPAPSRPNARVHRIEDWVQLARVGRIRVPPFQRAFKWEREDVEKLIDSVWRGYPIGTFLLWSKKGPAGPVKLGDLTFEVHEQGDAWFVVDGQQRIVSLVSTLLPGTPRSEKFDLYFDLSTGRVAHPQRGNRPPTFLPLNRVVDSEDLLAWIDENRSVLDGEALRLAIRVGKALREYEIPSYIVEVDDEQVVREIFERVNSTGKGLEVSDVFNALHAPSARNPSATLGDVVQRLATRSLGIIEQDHVLRGLLAIAGKDLSGDLQRQLQDVDIPTAVQRVESAMERVFSFLAQDAVIPHLSLLPYRSPLTVLSVYFDRFPTPSQRARRLLTRWLWRGTASEELRGDGKGMRPALDSVRSAPSDEAAALGVLATVSKLTSAPGMTGASFNLRHAHSRLIAIALVQLRPHDLRTHQPLDLTSVLNSSEEVFPQIVTYKPRGISGAKAELFSSAGNRLLHPPLQSGSFLSLLEEPSLNLLARPNRIPPEVLASHGITPEAIAALGREDRIAFLDIRRRYIEKVATDLINSRAEWEQSDRQSIASLVDDED
jgi:hypothetical protein